jgi:tight adherence protein C
VSLTSAFLGVLASIGAILVWKWMLGAVAGGGSKHAARVAEFGEHGMPLSLQEIESARPFRERVLTPLRDRLLATVAARTPASRQAQLKTLIAAAGQPPGVSVAGVLAAKLVCAVAAGALGAVLAGLLFHAHFPLNALGLALGLGGWRLPQMWLQQKAKKRRAVIEKIIPDTIDMLTICLSASLSLDAGLQEVADKVKGPLGTELGLMLSDIHLGIGREEAMVATAARIGADDWTAFTQAVIQSQKLGAPIAPTVRIQAAEIRRRRRQRAQEKAAQASLKMLFPMVGCIFPTLLIVLMGPVALILLTRH